MANILNWRDQVKFGSGDTIRVHQTVREGNKTRIQIFEGLVVRIKGHGGLKSFTVRKIAAGGIGVERIFPEESPTVTKVEVTKRGQVRRAHLGYLRSREGKRATKVKDSFVKGVSQKIEEQVVVKEEMTSEEELIARRAAKAAKEQRLAKKADQAGKEKKKADKKKKIQRKERVFVR